MSEEGMVRIRQPIAAGLRNNLEQSSLLRCDEDSGRVSPKLLARHRARTWLALKGPRSPHTRRPLEQPLSSALSSKRELGTWKPDISRCRRLKWSCHYDCFRHATHARCYGGKAMETTRDKAMRKPQKQHRSRIRNERGVEPLSHKHSMQQLRAGKRTPKTTHDPRRGTFNPTERYENAWWRPSLAIDLQKRSGDVMFLWKHGHIIAICGSWKSLEYEDFNVHCAPVEERLGGFQARMPFSILRHLLGWDELMLILPWSWGAHIRTHVLRSSLRSCTAGNLFSDTPSDLFPQRLRLSSPGSQVKRSLRLYLWPIDVFPDGLARGQHR
ncbi:hypothetical protein K504DRAFT_502547 [Pleomassaria siparia CBS 279.74]|uniref:Uncharacterized protein n=1 Tax=Pleomassaria siparia CBS 279.74 TaxID=1314801 RepID=A0A6G1KAB4_9PLEO|nr:hypothetical protein K504DRAFT_502547 [Pleomassaria siparia CBS 279.74]